ncbi:GUN4 domain-containing protein [Leptolyngbya sp. FACHB-321]|uniref:GUN4 domain-containing protein n=1 Tax=Leptolyngbya sp. FACHB-321 TaxID=2692807 RepID=UPI00168A12EE|nr:GUN4 domain-containing protein [Leptolyngbya sp. FACHB-321]MBD2038359.1 GUN4 domain-containing protein [Leptolyngbya sp. FACHB-321]
MKGNYNRFSPTQVLPEKHVSEEVIKVFISYSWDSEDHKDKVYHLAQALRDDGIDCIIDQFVQSPDNWDRWMLDQIDESDFVLIICTERYYQRYRGKEEVNKGLGVTWESTLIMGRVHDAQGRNTKFYPIFFDTPNRGIIPDGIRTAFYNLSGHILLNLDNDENRLIENSGYKDLYRLLTKQPAVIPKKLGSLKKLETVDREIEERTKRERLQREQQRQAEQLKREEVEATNLMSQHASLANITTLKNDAYRAERKQDWDLAQRLWVQVLAATSGSDMEAIEALQSLGIQQLTRTASSQRSSRAGVPPAPKQPSSLGDDLSSEVGVSYTALRDVLREGQWWEANIRTKKIMLKIAKREEERWLNDSSIENFPCIDLRTIDNLWMNYSQGKFGFSIQKRIWQECGSPRDSNENWNKFGDCVGWRTEGEWIFEGDETFAISAPKGHLPFCTVWGLYNSSPELGYGVIFSISLRLVVCDVNTFQPEPPW